MGGVEDGRHASDTEVVDGGDEAAGNGWMAKERHGRGGQEGGEHRQEVKLKEAGSLDGREDAGSQEGKVEVGTLDQRVEDVGVAGGPTLGAKERGTAEVSKGPCHPGEVRRGVYQISEELEIV